MNFNYYCIGGYHGYLKNGVPTLPPLGQFSQLPWELQVEIIKQAVGPDVAKSLTQMELISSQWRNYVTVTLWPLFLKRQFPAEKIAEATEIINYYRKQPTLKNIYRLLTAKSVSVDLSTTKFQVESKIITPSNFFFWHVKNNGLLPIMANVWSGPKLTRRLDFKRIDSSSGYRSLLYPPNGIYTLSLICFIGIGCQATGEIREFPL
jgi:hypothetical protein